MAKKYNFSIRVGDETFGVESADSFDEAIKVVKRGVYDRKLELEKELDKAMKEPGEIHAAGISAKSGERCEVSKETPAGGNIEKIEGITENETGSDSQE